MKIVIPIALAIAAVTLALIWQFGLPSMRQADPDHPLRLSSDFRRQALDALSAAQVAEERDADGVLIFDPAYREAEQAAGALDPKTDDERSMAGSLRLYVSEIGLCRSEAQLMESGEAAIVREIGCIKDLASIHIQVKGVLDGLAPSEIKRRRAASDSAFEARIANQKRRAKQRAKAAALQAAKQENARRAAARLEAANRAAFGLLLLTPRGVVRRCGNPKRRVQEDTGPTDLSYGKPRYVPMLDYYYERRGRSLKLHFSGVGQTLSKVSGDSNPGRWAPLLPCLAKMPEGAAK